METLGMLFPKVALKALIALEKAGLSARLSS
jgi:hypothetical protein